MEYSMLDAYMTRVGIVAGKWYEVFTRKVMTVEQRDEVDVDCEIYKVDVVDVMNMMGEMLNLERSVALEDDEDD